MRAVYIVHTKNNNFKNLIKFNRMRSTLLNVGTKTNFS